MITTLDQYIDAKANRSQFFSTAVNSSAIISAAGVFFSTWQFPGFPGPGVTPPTGAGSTCTRSGTAGAFPFAAAAGSNTLYLDHCSMVGGTSLNLFVADRLVHTSGLSGTVTTAQTVNTVALPSRASTGVGVQVALEPYTNLGGTSVTYTVSYTNTESVSGRTATATGVMNGIGKMLILPLASGDLGVLSVQTVTLSATTGTAGNFGVTLFKPIAPFPGGTGIAVAPASSTIDTSVMSFAPDACLWTYAMGAGTSSIIQQNVTIIDG